MQLQYSQHPNNLMCNLDSSARSGSIMAFIKVIICLDWTHSHGRKKSANELKTTNMTICYYTEINYSWMHRVFR